MYLNLNKSESVQNKILSSIGFFIDKKNVKQAVLRIESFTRQKAVYLLSNVSFIDFLDRSKNKESLAILNDLYFNLDFSKIKISFLQNNFEQIKPILEDLNIQESNIDKEELFKFIFSVIVSEDLMFFGNIITKSLRENKIIDDHSVFRNSAIYAFKLIKNDIKSFDFLSTYLTGVNNSFKTVIIKNQVKEYSISFENELIVILEKYLEELSLKMRNELSNLTQLKNRKCFSEKEKIDILNVFNLIEQNLFNEIKIKFHRYIHAA